MWMAEIGLRRFECIWLNSHKTQKDGADMSLFIALTKQEIRGNYTIQVHT